MTISIGICDEIDDRRQRQASKQAHMRRTWKYPSDLVMHDEDCRLPSLDWLTEAPTKSEESSVANDNENQILIGGDIDFSRDAIKPPYSYAQLITLAMRHHRNCKVLLSDIYDYIKTNFAWYRKADLTWQNSIRHNLSLNKQFVKLPRKEGDKGKGSYWILDPNVPDPLSTKTKKSAYTQTKSKSIETIPKLNPALLPYLKKYQTCGEVSYIDLDSGTSISMDAKMICQLDNPTIDVVDYDFATLESEFGSNNCGDLRNSFEANEYFDEQVNYRINRIEFHPRRSM
ncbi:unnamed protein product [Dracunculus medinensis]|uniref:Forkhead box protein fkh-2 n=1 Tax=Dracunculus medinensis TaxID=318479 RepID=A0A158Q596_DRAME|nr:unnamed protein product [Dracunculus medinensis]